MNASLSRRLAAALAAAHLALAAALAWGEEASVRDQEMNECRDGEISTWGDGVDRAAFGDPLTFVYDHAGAPPWFSAQLVTEVVARAADARSRCGIDAVVRPGTATELPAPGTPARRGIALVRWSEAGSRGNAALANLGDATLSLNPAIFQLLRQRRPDFDASQTLQMAVSHEMGHFYGLMAHSRRCVDVLSYYFLDRGGHRELCYRRDGQQGNGGTEYRSMFPTACDIQRCRRANHMPPLPGGRLGLQR